MSKKTTQLLRENDKTHKTDCTLWRSDGASHIFQRPTWGTKLRKTKIRVNQWSQCGRGYFSIFAFTCVCERECVSCCRELLLCGGCYSLWVGMEDPCQSCLFKQSTAGNQHSLLVLFVWGSGVVEATEQIVGWQMMASLEVYNSPAVMTDVVWFMTMINTVHAWLESTQGRCRSSMITLLEFCMTFGSSIHPSIHPQPLRLRMDGWGWGWLRIIIIFS